MSRFREAAVAAAALGVDPAHLALAERRLRERNRQVSGALQAAVAAVPFSARAFEAHIGQAEQLGLHADAVQAQQALQHRRQRAAARVQELAAEGGAEEVQAACSDALHLGLAAEAAATLGRLEQRQQMALEELRRAAHEGTLSEYTAAALAGEQLAVSPAVRHACRQQLRHRQQHAEQQLHEAACCGSLAALRSACQVALALGLEEPAGAAERQAHARQRAAVEQLAASTREVCSWFDQQVGQGNHPCFQLQRCLGDVRRLADTVAGMGAHLAVLHAPANCPAWPMQLSGWLADAKSAAELEQLEPVVRAVTDVSDHLSALVDAARGTAVPLGCPGADPVVAGEGHAGLNTGDGSNSSSKPAACDAAAAGQTATDDGAQQRSGAPSAHPTPRLTATAGVGGAAEAGGADALAAAGLAAALAGVRQVATADGEPPAALPVGQQVLSQLHAAATAVQREWRRHAARCARQRLWQERRAVRQAAAATHIQAAWRGWWCRSRSACWVQQRLATWRHGWRAAQRLVLDHQQAWAATSIQARPPALLCRQCMPSDPE